MALQDIPALDWPALRALRHPCLIEGRMAVMALERLRGGQVYLATPYTKLAQFEGAFCEFRSHAAGLVAARWLLRLAVAGVSAVSPIAAAAAMLDEDLEGALRPLDERFWAAWCAPILTASHAVAVPMIPGWSESAGVWHECLWALSANRIVVLIQDEVD